MWNSDKTNKADLTSYNKVLSSVKESDYTVESWNIYKKIVESNVVTEKNTQERVEEATEIILQAQSNLVLAEKVSHSYSFEAKLDKTEYTLNEDIVLSGKVLKEEKPLSDTHVTIKVIPANEGFPITFDEVKTDNEGKFTYTFRVPKETIAGGYEVIVQANGEVNKSQKLDLVILDEKKSDVKVSFNYSEYTVKVRKYIPESGNLIITTTGLKDEEIKSVTVKSNKENIVTITQRPEWAEGGYPKSKTRAFGKAVGSGEAIIIATVIDINGNEYTAQCKVKVQ